MEAIHSYSSKLQEARPRLSKSRDVDLENLLANTTDWTYPGYSCHRLAGYEGLDTSFEALGETTEQVQRCVAWLWRVRADVKLLAASSGT